uniref:Uncharacterized protein n=1 Tax=Engystomops pustulosus TaxID=76066 RepID=A0AAV6YQD8_ENGPU|nr:hypothetical protein GDO81_020667 [Engystomops pustulosus]
MRDLPLRTVHTLQRYLLHTHYLTVEMYILTTAVISRARNTQQHVRRCPSLSCLKGVCRVQNASRTNDRAV